MSCIFLIEEKNWTWKQTGMLRWQLWRERRNLWFYTALFCLGCSPLSNFVAISALFNCGTQVLKQSFQNQLWDVCLRKIPLWKIGRKEKLDLRSTNGIVVVIPIIFPFLIVLFSSPWVLLDLPVRGTAYLIFIFLFFLMWGPHSGNPLFLAT